MKSTYIALLVAFGVAHASAQTLQVTSNGVGIGTSTPSANLHVHAAVNDIVKFETAAGGGMNFLELVSNAGAGNYGSRLDFIDGSTYSGHIVSLADGGLRFGTLNTERMAIDASGNVGIGTMSPSTYLPGVVGATVRGSYPAVSLAGTEANSNFFLMYENAGTFRIYSNAGTADRLTIDSSGDIGIGTASPGYKLTVSGPVRATQFIADVNTYSDSVFKSDYRLQSLASLEAAINRDGHLPGIPSETEAKAHGMDLAAMQAGLLEKVEQLALYVIQLEKENDALRSRVTALETKQ